MISKLVSVGCDGTVVNTSTIGGIIRVIEEHLQRPLQWMVCQFHAIEIPLRNLCLYLDGHTKGPRCCSGTLKEQLNCCYKLPIVDFIPIGTSLPEIHSLDLSTDQVYQLDICHTVSFEHCPLCVSKKIQVPFRT